MKALTPSELRIGNYIRANLAVLDMNIFTEQASFDDRRIRDGKDIDNAKWFQPIVASEAWMTKLGFKMVLSAGGYYFKMDEDYRFCIINGIVHVSVGEDKLGLLLAKLQYVHELQNLYYALKNIEL